MVCYVDSKLFSRLLMSAGIGLIIAAHPAAAGEIPRRRQARPRLLMRARPSAIFSRVSIG